MMGRFQHRGRTARLGRVVLMVAVILALVGVGAPRVTTGAAAPLTYAKPIPLAAGYWQMDGQTLSTDQQTAKGGKR